MCLSRSGVRSISGFSRAFRMNGAIAFTSCTSSNSTDGNLGRHAAPGIALPQIHLLQVLIQFRPSGNKAFCAAQFLRQQADLRQLRRVRQPGDFRHAPFLHRSPHGGLPASM
jgi:hypothetical protein